MSGGMRHTLDGWRPERGDHVRVVTHLGMVTAYQTMADTLALALEQIEKYAVGVVEDYYQAHGCTRWVVRFGDRDRHYPAADSSVLVQVPYAQMGLW